MDRNRYVAAPRSSSNSLYSRRNTLPATGIGESRASNNRAHPYYDARRPTPPQRDAYGSRDPYGQRDPYGTRDPYGLRDPYGPRDAYGPRDPSKVVTAKDYYIRKTQQQALKEKTTTERPYQRRYDIAQQSSSNPGVRGNQVFDEHGRQQTYDECVEEQKTLQQQIVKPKKIYTTNEEEYNNPQLALKYTKPYDTYEKFYQFIINRPPNPFEQKVIKLMDTVFSQPGVRAKLILMQSEEDKPLQTLQGSVDCCKSTLVLDMNEEGDHVLLIDGEEICKGKFQNKQIAKNILGERSLEILKRHCFLLIKKPDVYEDVDTDAKRVIEPGPGPSPYASGSKAFEMMKKMGWAGKGLGLNEQGEARPVADIIDQNVTKRGFGSQVSQNRNAVYREIARIFDDFKESAKISVLRFAPDFNKEERAYIHTMALKAGLKSKSEGKAPDRRITITQKLTRDELVHSLLLIGCESALYKLEIPEKFMHLWITPGELYPD